MSDTLSSTARLAWTETERETRDARVIYLESIATHQGHEYHLVFAAYWDWADVWLINTTTDEFVFDEWFKRGDEDTALARYHHLRDTFRDPGGPLLDQPGR